MLAETLEDFRITQNANDLPTIATLPPDFQTIPCKPTFFDISLNHIGKKNYSESSRFRSGEGRPISIYPSVDFFWSTYQHVCFTTHGFTTTF